MFTHSYRSGFIHGYCDRDECHAQLADGTQLGRFPNYHAAQRAITTALRASD